MTDLRIPPHDNAAEVALLGSVILEGGSHLLATLPASAFYAERNRLIWTAMQNLSDHARPVDLVELPAALGDHLDTVGGLNYLIGLSEQTPTSAYQDHYADRVTDLWQRRSFMAELGRLMLAASDSSMAGTPTEDLADAASRLPSLLTTTSAAQFTSHSEAIDAALHEMAQPTADVISTGLRDLDTALLGFEAGALYVLAARPAMGKTGLGYHFALSAAREGRKVAVASLEMPPRQLAMRALATAASVDLSRIRHKTTTAAERERLNREAARTRSLPIKYLRGFDQTGATIARDVRKMTAEGGCDLLMIDYLQLMESGKTSENRQQEVSTLSRNLKKLALELSIPIIVLSQLSRAVESRPGKKPQLSDLRESGAVEQDADVVMFIWREEYYEPNTDRQGIADIIIGKQRSGPVGTVELSFNAEYVRFGNLTNFTAHQAAD